MRIALLLLAFSVALTVSPPSAIATSTSTGTLQHLEAEVHDLRLKAESEKEARTSETNSYNADAQAISIETGIVVLIIGVATIGAALLGLRIIKAEARRTMETQVDNAIRATGREIFEREAGQLSVEWDRRFADEFAAFHRLNQGEAE